jgi:hypothetical protein
MALVTIFVFGCGCAAIGLEGGLMLVRMPRSIAMAAFIISGCFVGRDHQKTHCQGAIKLKRWLK